MLKTAIEVRLIGYEVLPGGTVWMETDTLEMSGIRTGTLHRAAGVPWSLAVLLDHHPKGNNSQLLLSHLLLLCNTTF